MTMLVDRAVLLAKVETTFGTDASPAASTDALLIGAPEFSLDINQLTRDNVRDDLSPLPTSAGRKVASITFTHEVRGNGNLDGTVAPRIGALLRACGMAQAQVTGAAGTIGTPVAGGSNVGTLSFVKTTAYAGYMKRTITLTCTTGGASGTAKVSVTAPALGEVGAVNTTDVTVTTGTPITLADGAQITPTLSGSLTVGDTWTVVLTPAGYQYSPISTAFESVTLYLYRDGLLHKLTGARGTFSVQNTGGEYGLFTFTFTGNYNAVTDTAMVSPTYETQKPTQVELAQLTVGAFSGFAAAEFTFDMANDVQIRENINAAEAYAGSIIVGRAPVITFNPEAELEATHPVWADLAAGTQKTFSAKIGKAKGNVVQFEAPNVQFTGVQYGDRNSILTYDITMNCARTSGNDEILISFR